MDGDGWLEVLDVLDVLQTTELFWKKRRHDLLRIVKDSPAMDIGSGRFRVTASLCQMTASSNASQWRTCLRSSSTAQRRRPG